MKNKNAYVVVQKDTRRFVSVHSNKESANGMIKYYIESGSSCEYEILEEVIFDD